MDSQVELFLGAVAEKILNETPPNLLAKLDGTAFQNLVIETASRLNTEAAYGMVVRATPPQAFPDMVVNRTGVEIKATVKDHWKTTGNSISESRRDKEIDEVVFFFGKLGGTPGIKIRPYESCLSTILVTHNPRYEVNMELANGESIFDSMNTTYDEFRLRGYPIREIRDFLRSKLKPGEELWWMGDIESEQVSQPILHTFSNGDPRREDFRKLALALHPEILGNSGTKYLKLPALLVKRFNAVTPNIRDYFSAGGRQTWIDAENNVHNVRAIDYKLLLNAKEIANLILKEDPSELANSWGLPLPLRNPISSYIAILTATSRSMKTPYDLGKLFQEKLG